MRRTVVFAALGVLALSACNSESRRYSEADVEYKLAVIAGGGGSDSDVDRYARALDAAEPACQESRTGIADVAVAGTKAADGQGIDATILELLGAIDESVPEAMRPTKCADIVAAYIVFKGQ